MPLPRLALLLLGATLAAQAADDASRVRVTFRALSFEGPILGAVYQEGKAFRSFDISSDCFTPEHGYVGPNPLRLDQKQLEEIEEAPETLAARTELNQAQLRIQALAKEMEPLQEQIAALGSDIRERGEKAKPSAPGQLRQLEAQLEELNRRMGALTKAAGQAREKVLNPPPRPARPEPKKPKKEDVAKKPPAPKPEDHANLRPLADVTFPGDGRYLLLILRGPAGSKVNVIDDKEGAFPFGSMQFINLAGVPVEIRFGSATLALKPNGKGVLRAGVANNSYADGEIHTQGDDGLQLGYSMRTFQQDDVRTLYFLMPGEPGSHGVRLKGVEERRMPDAPVKIPDAGTKPGK